MISLSRVVTLLKKDILWSSRNLKLLTVMLVPVLFVLFLARSEKTLVFSIIFTNVFIGLFSTSYLIIEEKQKGTLLALLTTPLSGLELLLGKMFFNIFLCLFFSVLAMLIGKRFDLLTNYTVLINLALFAGMTCFVGYLVGLFFKNEQEMGVAAPMLMPLFSFGDIIQLSSGQSMLTHSLPDYHLARLLREDVSSFPEILFHMGFNVLYFLILLVTGVFYTQFYFSNNKERRFSKVLVFGALAFIGALLVSGFVNKKDSVVSESEQGLIEQRLAMGGLKTSFRYSSHKFDLEKRVAGNNRHLYSLVDPANEKSVLVVSYGKADDETPNRALKIQKMEENKMRLVLSKEEVSKEKITFVRWKYFYKKDLVYLSETFCGPLLLQISLIVKAEDVESIKESVVEYEKLFKDLEVSCDLDQAL